MENEVIIKILTKGAEEASKAMNDVAKAAGNISNMSFKETQQFVKLYKVQKNYEKEIDVLTGKTKKFNAQTLTLMFTGMQLSRSMNDLIQTSLDWAGTNEIMSDAMGLLFLPTALQLNDWALKFFDAISKLPEPIKGLVGDFALLGLGAGTLMTWLGQAGLAMYGLKGAADVLGISLGTTGIGGTLTAFAGTAGPLALFVAAAIAARVAWDSNFLGIRDTTIQVMSVVRPYFTWIADDLKILRETIINIFSTIETAALNFGKNFVTNIINGITSLMPSLGNIFKNLVPSITIPTGGGNILTSTLDSIRNSIASWLGSIGLQEGGIITRPTLATVGEKGPEAVIPLDKFGSTGSFNPYIVVNASISNQMDLKNLATKLSEYMYDEWRAKSFGR